MRTLAMACALSYGIFGCVVLGQGTPEPGPLEIGFRPADASGADASAFVPLVNGDTIDVVLGA